MNIFDRYFWRKNNNFKKGYTLVELIIVIAIVLLMAAFGVPAISKYGRVSEYNQKADEVKLLFNQIYAKAMNPVSSTATSYRIYFDDNGDVAENNKFILVECTKSGTDLCPGAPATGLVKETVLLKDEALSLALNGADWLIDCSTKLVNGKVVCNGNTSITGIGTGASLFTGAIYKDSDTRLLNGNAARQVSLTIQRDPYVVELNK